jgi:hypothetical protein
MVRTLRRPLYSLWLWFYQVAYIPSRIFGSNAESTALFFIIG